MTKRASNSDEFYVGYLSVPWGHSRFLRVAVPVTLWVMVFVAMGVAWTQRDPGRAVWEEGPDSGFFRLWDGVLRAKPYPMVELINAREEGVALLVEMGKHGASERAAAFDGRHVMILGNRVERDGRRIIELADSPDAIVTHPDPAPRGFPPEEDLGEVTLTGEIVDAKCFLGVMKPGEGMTHKSCAILCLTGGIPPMLVARDEAGIASYYLLTDENGGPMAAELIPLAGEPVEVTGMHRKWGDLDVLHVRIETVKKR